MHVHIYSHEKSIRKHWLDLKDKHVLGSHSLTHTRSFLSALACVASGLTTVVAAAAAVAVAATAAEWDDALSVVYFPRLLVAPTTTTMLALDTTYDTMGHTTHQQRRRQANEGLGQPYGRAWCKTRSAH